MIILKFLRDDQNSRTVGGVHKVFYNKGISKPTELKRALGGKRGKIRNRHARLLQPNWL